MYGLYSRSKNNGRVTLEKLDTGYLAGCKKGVVALELQKILTPEDNPLSGWKIPVAEIYNKEDEAFIINLKPNSDELLICELDTVFGYSYNEWSPIMLRLRKFSFDEEIDRESFQYSEKESEIIYTVLYLNGSFRDGKIIGTWTIPFGTVTGVLFWPEAMTFFFVQAKLTDPAFITHKIEVIQSMR